MKGNNKRKVEEIIFNKDESINSKIKIYDSINNSDVYSNNCIRIL